VRTDTAKRRLWLGVGVAALAAVVATGAFGVSGTPAASGALVAPSAARITAGYAHTCALTSGGGVKCWGGNPFGELGNGGGVLDTALNPVDVAGLTSGVKGIVAGTHHTCALTSGGAVKCWGQNIVGQLGSGLTPNGRTPVPVDVVGLTSGVRAIAAGTDHTCALTSGGAVKCWGVSFATG